MTDTGTEAIATATCWSCGGATAAGEHLCSACGRIQPLPAGTDHFRFFGLPRKLWMDMSALEQRFHQLSWKLHPDNFVRSSEREREISLDRSSQLNDAYRTLRDPVRRVEYLLAIEGARKEGQTKQQAPPELLQEVFELNESLDELRASRQASADGAEFSALRTRLEAAGQGFEEKLREIDEQIFALAREWDTAIDAGEAAADQRKQIAARLNEILNRRSYVRNLVNNVAQELAEA
jgi:molecular chaperone HscB